MKLQITNRGNPLPLKLYKYYLSKNIEYTHYKNIDDEVYDTYNEIPEPEYYIGSISKLIIKSKILLDNFIIFFSYLKLLLLILLNDNYHV